MQASSLIENTKNFVQQQLAGAEGGHDWFHNPALCSSIFRQLSLLYIFNFKTL